MRKDILAIVGILGVAFSVGWGVGVRAGQQAAEPLYMSGIRYDLPGALVTAADLARTRSEMAASKQTDVPVRMLDGGGEGRGHHIGVSVVSRARGQKGAAVIHDQVSEVYHILEGAGTVVVGGRLTNPKRRPVTVWNGPGISGDGIEGGVEMRLARGDVAIIPAGTPHWFTSVDEAMFYTVVRGDPSKVTPIK